MNQPVFRRKTTFVEVLGILCVFSVFFDKAVRNVFAFDLYYNYPIFILFLLAMTFSYGKLVVPPAWLIKGLVIIATCSIFILLVNNRMGFEFWKQIFGIVFTSFVFYNVLFVFQFDTRRVFRYYLISAFWISLFGVVNNALHMAGIHLTQTIRAGVLYRESSIMGEPFYLALALTPAIAYYIAYFNRTWRESKFQFVVILVCYLLTFSTIAVTGLALSVVLALYLNDYFNVRKNRLLLAPLLLLPIGMLINFLVSNVNLINARFADTTELFFDSELNMGDAGRANSSTFALYSNYIIARDSFLNEPIFGSGLGSHPLIYKETFLKYFPTMFLERYGPQNQQDANSKFLRLMSETGLVGLGLFMLIFIKYFARRKKMITDDHKELGAINYAIFIYILLCLIRNGNYINVGFFLFLFMYYLSSKEINSYVKRARKSQPMLQA